MRRRHTSSAVLAIEVLRLLHAKARVTRSDSFPRGHHIGFYPSVGGRSARRECRDTIKMRPICIH